MNRQFKTISGIVLFVLVFAGTMQYCKPSDKDASNIAALPNAYIGAEKCQSCHPKQYEDWKMSDHFKAMQEPTDSAVLGNFNNASLQADGVSSRFFKKEGKYIVNTQGEDGLNHDYTVKYAFGHYPLQQYLIEFPDGRMQVTRQSWDSRDKKWFQQYKGQNIHYKDWLHWTGNAQNWNTMCAECHSTNLKKNYDLEKDSYQTSYDLLTVSCEACHGPGEQHVKYINGKDYQSGNKQPNSLLLLAKNTKQLDQINACAPCHAVQSNVAADKIASAELLDNHIPAVPNTERFHADGQVNEEDYNYTSFLQSKMFARGVQCSNCHNPHSGKLVLPGNLTCLQCHAKTFDEPSHHFHTINTAGAACVNCHAPGKNYMGNDLRHDHSFRVPRPDMSVSYATPNACNNCHQDKPAKWAADAVTKWYGPKRKYSYVEDLIPGSQLNNKSEPHLLRLLQDSTTPNIIKATALNYLGATPFPNGMSALMESLTSPDAQIRYEALRSLQAYPKNNMNLGAIAALLKDKVRAVRIAAADLINSMGKNIQVPEEYQSAYQTAKAEMEKNLLHQADFAHGNIGIANHYQRNGEYANAEKFYLRALKKDSLANLARLNLAVTYNLQGKNQDAIQVLQLAAKTDPKNDRAWYNLGLLYNELKDNSNAAMAFEKAIQLNSQNSRLYYNYGLLLQQMGKAEKASQVLEQGLKSFPQEESLHYALAYVYLQNSRPDKARTHVMFLKQVNPNNPEYQQLFSSLGIR